MMKLYLPFPDFSLSAAHLSTEDVKDQRLEVLAILETIYGKGKHPDAKYWRDSEGHLLTLLRSLVHVYKSRGNQDVILDRALSLMTGQKVGWRKPIWLGDVEVHKEHRAYLLRRNPKHYGRYGWKEQPLSNENEQRAAADSEEVHSGDQDEERKETPPSVRRKSRSSR